MTELTAVRHRHGNRVFASADRCFMLHKFFSGVLPTRSTPESLHKVRSAGPQLVTHSNTEMSFRVVSNQSGFAAELFAIASRRCSAFFAEASVLVLVFGILDFVIQKGHIESAWVAGALLISIALLAASIATEFSARRWLGAQP